MAQTRAFAIIGFLLWTFLLRDPLY